MASGWIIQFQAAKTSTHSLYHAQHGRSCQQAAPFVVVKLCPRWGKSKSCLPKSWQIIAQLLPIYDLEKITAAPLSRPYLTGL
jgi:hypothetical protein